MQANIDESIQNEGVACFKVSFAYSSSWKTVKNVAMCGNRLNLRDKTSSIAYKILVGSARLRSRTSMHRERDVL